MRVLAFVLLVGASLLQLSNAYWMENITHQGQASFNPDASYQVFRNVKDFGAKGDGVTDDTFAINSAISSGNRCGFDGFCGGSTITPATVYFPAGTYLVSYSILDFYYTQLVGDPTAMPVIKATSTFNIHYAFGIIEGDRYNGSSGELTWADTNVFARQIRNLVIDTSDIPYNAGACGVHWPTAQATSIQNVVFKLSQTPGNNHVGVYMEGGSGGYMGDVTFYGGLIGAQFGNQQFTMRNLTFIDCGTAIQQVWDWFWVYVDITIINCGIGIDMRLPSIGSVMIIDSFFYNTPLAISSNTSTTHPGSMQSQGSLILENVGFVNVTAIFEDPDTILSPSSGAGATVITGQVLGNVYTPTGPKFVFEGPNDWFPSPSALKNATTNKYYTRSKPQYEDTPPSLIISPHSFGAKGDGITDDTNALNIFFTFLAQHYDQGFVGFVDAGYYLVTDTVYIPGNSRIVGEALASVILAAGPKFSDAANPRTVVQVGKAGEKGYLEWSDMFISTQGGTAGAVLIEYNLASADCDYEVQPAGIWDVHIRIGGFAGSDLQKEQCSTTRNQTNVIKVNCIAAYMGMHITDSASNLYMENNWFWVSDHDIEDYNDKEITVFAGRGLLIESQGPIWVAASAVEHFTLYQYQVSNAQNIFMGQIQTETPYYQPNPPAPYPFDNISTALNDPDFVTDCAQLVVAGSNITAPCEMAWGLRIVDSSNVVIYGAGLYSFFNNYSTKCSAGPYGGISKCQSRMVWVEDTTGNSQNVVLYDLFTIGTISMVTNNGVDVALWKDNWNVFGESLALFKPESSVPGDQAPHNLSAVTDGGEGLVV